MTFKTPKPATYTDPDTGQEYTLTFDAQGTATPSGPQLAKITNGTIQLQPNFNGNGSQTLTGILPVDFIPLATMDQAFTFYATIQNVVYVVESALLHRIDNPISISATGSSESLAVVPLVVRLNVLLLKVEEETLLTAYFFSFFCDWNHHRTR